MCVCFIFDATVEKQRERGLILTILYSIGTTQVSDKTVSNYIQSNFFKISPFGEPASAQFNVGYKTEDNFFITLAVTQYKMAAGKIPAMRTGEVIDIKSLPIVDSGIELKVDINSRPLLGVAEQPSNDVTTVILKKTFDFLKNDADKFIGAQNG